MTEPELALRPASAEQVRAPTATVEAPTRTGAGVVDVAFGLIVAATSVWYFHLSRAHWFHHDDWTAALRFDDSMGDLLRPKDGHLSLVPLLLWRGLLAASGLTTYVPFRVLALACLAGLAVAMFLLYRDRVGVTFALLAGTWVLWMSQTNQFPFLVNFYIPLAVAVACGALLPSRTARSDMLIGVLLLLAIATSGVAVPVLAACGVHTIATRGTARRWAAVLLPSAAWVGWWVVWADDALGPVDRNPFLRLGLGARLELVVDGIADTFRVLGLGEEVLGTLLGIGFAALAIRRLVRHSPAVASTVAWSSALVVWWVGIVQARSWLGFEAPRYRHAGAVFVLLAVVPAQRSQMAHRLGARAPSMVAVTLLVVATMVANHGRIEDAANVQTDFVRRLQAEAMVADLGPTVVPDDARIHATVRTIDARTYRSLAARFGTPSTTSREEVDQRLVDIGAVVLTPKGRAVPPAGCIALDGPIRRPASANVNLIAGDAAVDIAIRRFGDEPVAVGRVAAHQRVVLTAPALGAEQPWEISAAGACVGREAR